MRFCGGVFLVALVVVMVLISSGAATFADSWWIGLGLSWTPTWRYESAVRKVRMQSEKGAPKRVWARHKTQAVRRLLRGEDIDPVAGSWV